MELPVPGRSGVRLDVESYYFYLAFENTLCKDYITEKVQKKHCRGKFPAGASSPGWLPTTT
jgi:hypothetical protein